MLAQKSMTLLQMYQNIYSTIHRDDVQICISKSFVEIISQAQP